MITKKHRLLFFDTYVEVWDITVWQYVRFLEWDETVFVEIFWQKVKEMCKRQQENALKILLGWFEANELKERLWAKKVPKWEKIEAEHFFILEWKIMLALHQSRSEIRSWEFPYFMKMYDWMWVVTGDEKYDDYKNKQMPDKKGIKNALSIKK